MSYVLCVCFSYMFNNLNLNGIFICIGNYDFISFCKTRFIVLEIMLCFINQLEELRNKIKHL